MELTEETGVQVRIIVMMMMILMMMMMMVMMMMQVFESVVDWESNGWITTSNIVVSPSPAHPSLTLRCTATNIQLKNKVAAKKWVQLRCELL